MKSGKKPTRNQKKEILAAGLNSNNWLVVKNLNDRLVLTHRETGRIKEVIR